MKICLMSLFLLKKRTDVLINGSQYYDTLTQKQETTEFYNYYDHLTRFGFIREYTPNGI